jgi:hypothetical protein
VLLTTQPITSARERNATSCARSRNERKQGRKVERRRKRGKEGRKEGRKEGKRGNQWLGLMIL